MRTQIDRGEVKKLLDAGLKYGDIAAQLGCSYSSIAHIARDLGHARRRPQVDHSEAIPWHLRPEHKRSAPAEYMRWLSRLAQGEFVDAYHAATAIKWAKSIVEDGKDIAYRPDEPPGDFCVDGGFYLVDAGKKPRERMHLGALLGEALQGAGWKQGQTDHNPA